jgi:hypothetical protein
MTDREPTRRRSPGWVRAYHSRGLHALAFRLMDLRRSADLSERQEWLWDAVISELEYRRRTHPRPAWACACQLCVPPFPD